MVAIGSAAELEMVYLTRGNAYVVPTAKQKAVLNLHDFEPAAGAHGAPALRYTYYYHATTVLEPSGGPSPLEPSP